LLIEPSLIQPRNSDEFLNTMGKLVHDPIKRALLQREWWGLFDWSASQPYEGRMLNAKLAHRLASRIPLALIPRIASLADNYVLAEQAIMTNRTFGFVRPWDC